jgi:CheY-like chemotaxis protein
MDFVSLPQGRAGDAAAAADAVARRAELSSRAPRILAVDDDPIMRELVRLHLSSVGYDVVVAEDAIVAGKMLLLSRPDLLLVDVDMPYLDGFEFVAAIKEDAELRAIPVIFLTARENSEKRTAELGAVRYLKKPIFSQQLISAVSAIVPVPDMRLPEAKSMRSRIATALSDLVGTTR